jgi:hypothetical protein
VISSESLLAKIRVRFPFVEMPPRENIIFRCTNDGYFDGLLADIEQYRERVITIDLIRILHQELSNLSSEALLWILPYYLEYCLSPEAEYSQMEVEYLIYALSPAPEYRSQVLEKLSAFNGPQIECLVEFVVWCQCHEFWRDYFPNELSQAKDLLGSLARQCGS